MEVMDVADIVQDYVTGVQLVKVEKSEMGENYVELKPDPKLVQELMNKPASFLKHRDDQEPRNPIKPFTLQDSLE